MKPGLLAAACALALTAPALPACDRGSGGGAPGSSTAPAPSSTAPDYDHWTVDFGALVDQADSVEVVPVGQRRAKSEVIHDPDEVKAILGCFERGAVVAGAPIPACKIATITVRGPRSGTIILCSKDHGLLQMPLSEAVGDVGVRDPDALERLLLRHFGIDSFH